MAPISLLNVRLWHLSHAPLPRVHSPSSTRWLDPFLFILLSLLVHCLLPVCSFSSRYVHSLLAVCSFSFPRLFTLPSLFSFPRLFTLPSPHFYPHLSLPVYSPLPTCSLTSPYLFTLLSLRVHSPLPTCLLSSPYVFTHLSLPVYSPLPTCSLTSPYLFTLLSLRVHSPLPTCLLSSPYVFTHLSLPVYSPLPTCLLSSPYLFIPASLPVSSPLRTCALSSHYQSTLPYFLLHSCPHSCASLHPTFHSPLHTGSLSSLYLFILLSVPVHSNLKGHIMPGLWGSLLLHTHQRIKSCPVIMKTASYKYGRSVQSRKENIDLKYATILFFIFYFKSIICSKWQ